MWEITCKSFWNICKMTKCGFRCMPVLLFIRQVYIISWYGKVNTSSFFHWRSFLSCHRVLWYFLSHRDILQLNNTLLCHWKALWSTSLVCICISCDKNIELPLLFCNAPELWMVSAPNMLLSQDNVRTVINPSCIYIWSDNVYTELWGKNKFCNCMSIQVERFCSVLQSCK
jgi:hypothetical protein